MQYIYKDRKDRRFLMHMTKLNYSNL